MIQYEAVVTDLLPDGKAEIMARPDKPGIPNAPAISARVCHCATGNSMVRAEALNRAGALVGDWVSVSRNSAAIMQNVGFLIGIPLAGAITGAVLGNLLSDVTLAIFSLIGACLGIMIGFLFYRRLSESNLPVIDRVIQTRNDVAGKQYSHGQER